MAIILDNPISQHTLDSNKERQLLVSISLILKMHPQHISIQKDINSLGETIGLAIQFVNLREQEASRSVNTIADLFEEDNTADAPSCCILAFRGISLVPKAVDFLITKAKEQEPEFLQVFKARLAQILYTSSDHIEITKDNFNSALIVQIKTNPLKGLWFYQGQLNKAVFGDDHQQHSVSKLGFNKYLLTMENALSIMSGREIPAPAQALAAPEELAPIPAAPAQVVAALAQPLPGNPLETPFQPPNELTPRGEISQYSINPNPQVVAPKPSAPPLPPSMYSETVRYAMFPANSPQDTHRLPPVEPSAPPCPQPFK